MKQVALILIFSAIVCLSMNSCKCKRDNNRQTPGDTTQIKVQEKKLINIQRFERDLFSVNLDSIPKSIEFLKSKYREFFDIYSYKIIQLGPYKNPKYPELFKNFLTDYYMNLDYQKVQKVFPDLQWLKDDLEKAFRNYHTNFPNGKIPRIYTCISGWNQSVFYSDTILGIALDKYLGRDCEFYDKLGLAKYMRLTLDKGYILSDCMKSWGYAEFYFNDSATNILNTMLYEGKILYFVKGMVPEINDTILFGFTPAQLKWCTNNSKQMWSYLTEHKMLFSTDYMMMRKLFSAAPFTAYYTNESPGMATVWLGFKIIESYMKSNKGITLQQLMFDTDYQKILRESDFQP